ncbi:MAG TPA: immunoglobulin domain-containing protein, partial [Opitutaceae bacterium]|nr:immunoglobulin domain-containing protein [Opitutaceae bacterium]
MRFSHHRILSVGLILTVAASPIARAQVNVTVDATKFVRVVDNRMFGLNTAVWDYGFQDSQTLTALQAVDAKFLRFPGGSSSDDFNWQNSTAQVEGTSSGRTTFDIFAATAKAIGAQVVITANFVTGTPDEAAAWVEYSNVTKGYGFKYWEIGNECYGTWEYYAPGAGSADPMVYATQAVKFIQKMKAVDPSIKIGVVGDASEDSYLDAPSESVINPVTGVSHSGWTPIVLATMKKSGVLPDYLIYHFYAQNPGSENDSLLLQESISWPVAATELRTQLTDYLGTAGSGVELLVTENNSCSYNPGKQMTSLVNGLYMADSVCSLMQTEFNSLVWWDLHNGQSTSNNNSSSLYGWRQYGDYGIESPAHDRYPAYYVMKLMSNFARGGDFVVTASSNNTLLSAYSVLRANGTLSILVVNKSPTVTYSTNFSINGFKPISAANVYAYGITEDTAAQTGTGSPDVAVSTISNAAASFAMSFSPYSVTLISMLSSPSAAPSATSQPASQTVASGSTAAFSFAVNGSPLPSYQWSFNGVAIPSGTASTFVVSGATPANAGSYTCTATNASGSVTSSAATLSVASSSNPGRLINISTRAVVGTGANILIPGFVIGGSGT